MITFNWKTAVLNKKSFWNALLNWDCAYRQGKDKEMDHTLNDILCAHDRYNRGQKLLKKMSPEQQEALTNLRKKISL